MQAHIHGSGFGTAASVQAFAARNLQLLSAIETTLGVLKADTAYVRIMAGEVEDCLAKLKSEQSDCPLDPSGRVCDLLHKCLDSASRMYADNKARKASAEKDSRLTPEDGIVDAFDAFLEGLRDLHDRHVDLLDWVETHDALLVPSSGKAYGSVDELFLAMGVKV
ncbi:hypothetical protein NWF24_17810 [Variovorax paradoxus]|uniref:hypothetical protein n=1 Tax=Variovorax paradoxus TaxID=34073 RepID=UPI0021ACBA5F|nr:hypothetical protein [Variovorax paradoxus]UVH54703.1 hypothetical protein NWF24_17810 [Variovorax paradoxus]